MLNVSDRYPPVVMVKKVMNLGCSEDRLNLYAVITQPII